MKKVRILSFIILMCNFICPSTSYSFSKELDQKLDTTIQESIDKYKIPGAVVGVWIPGKGEWSKAFGVADKETKEKMAIDDHFRIGSVTKTFVVTGVLQLVDKGKLSLDDPIGKYIPNVPNGEKVTIRHLANMTSGLPSYTKHKTRFKELLSDQSRVWKSQELLDMAFAQPVSFQPGESVEYSNTNTILLGLVIEKISGMDLRNYLEKNIFEPLKLKNTSLPAPTDSSLPKPYAQGYSHSEGVAKENNTFLNPSWGAAAGAMISNLHDMKIWAKALGTGALLSKESFKERLKWEKVGVNTDKNHYALGLGFDMGWLMHEGELPGYNTIVAYLPEKDVIFVCLVNTDDGIKLNDKKEISPTKLIFRDVADILFSDHIPSSLTW